MNLPKMIAELQAEKDRLDEAIFALERLSGAPLKRRVKLLRSAEPEEEPGEDEAPDSSPELIASGVDGANAEVAPVPSAS